MFDWTSSLSSTTIIAGIAVVVGLIALVNFSTWGGKKAANVAK